MLGGHAAAFGISAPYWAVAGTVFGLIIGSFLATIILRWPIGRSVAKGRSHCDGCGRPLTGFDLAPVLSYLVQRGRCRACKASIALLHPVVELASAAIGGLAFGLAPGLQGMALAIFAWLLLPLAILDWRHFWLPDSLTLPLAMIGALIGGFATGTPLLDRLVAGAGGYAFLLALAYGYRRLRNRDGLGGGDPKLFGAIGLWVGVVAMPLVLLVAALAGLAIYGLSSNARRQANEGRVAFGTMLCVATIPGWWIARIYFFAI